jgi:hypothetical protein
MPQSSSSSISFYLTSSYECSEFAHDALQLISLASVAIKRSSKSAALD